MDLVGVKKLHGMAAGGVLGYVFRFFTADDENLKTSPTGWRGK
jgi:hypothetical protein